MRFLTYLAAGLFIVFLSTSCEQTNICTTGDGNIVTEQLSVTSFTGIDLNVKGNVMIKAGDVASVTVTGEQNMIDRLRTEVNNQVWEIDFPGCNRNYDVLQFEITMPTISSLKVSSSGSISVADTFKTADVDLTVSGSGNINYPGLTDHASLKITGSGDIRADLVSEEIESSITGSGNLILSGATPAHENKISGSGDLNAYDLLTKETDIEVTGSGNAELNVSEFLTVKISGSGSVFYTGKPQVNVQVTGSGKVQNVD